MFKDKSQGTAVKTVLPLRQFGRGGFVEEIVLGRDLDHLNNLKVILLQD